MAHDASPSRAALAATAGAPGGDPAAAGAEGGAATPSRPPPPQRRGERRARSSVLSAGADASRSEIARRAKRRPRSPSRHWHTPPQLHYTASVPCGRGGKSGATRPRLLAAAAAQLAAEHGARRRAQLRPAPLPWFQFLALRLGCHEHTPTHGPGALHPPAGHAGAERGFCIDVARGVSECLDTLSCAQINNIELVRRSRFLSDCVR